MAQRSTLAMVLTAPGKLEKMSLPLPDINGHSALLRIEACGICGTDCEQFATGMNLPMPHIPGHEPLGIIEAIGDELARAWDVNVGDRVAVESLLSCQRCKRCLSGQYHLCPQRRVYSTIPITEGHGLWGAYADFMVLDARSRVHKMRKDIPAEIAVMYNPLGAGFRWAVEIPELTLDDSILIMGPGQRGLAAVIAAKQAGAGDIIVTGLEADHAKLALCQVYGATHTIDIQNQTLKTRVKEITDGAGVDIVLDVTPGATGPVEDALSPVRVGGTVVLAGIKGYKPVSGFISDKVVFKEIRLLGAFGVTASGYRSAIELIEAGQVPLAKMHTHSFAVEEAELAIRTLAREIPDQESIHSCLIPKH